MFDCRSNYLGCLFNRNQYEIIVQTLKKVCFEIGLDKFDAIMFRGMSGALVVPAVAHSIGKPMILSRKEDGSHSNHKNEGYCRGTSKVLIIDDCICTGNTIKSMVDTWKLEFSRPIEVVGIVLFNDPFCQSTIGYHLFDQVTFDKEAHDGMANLIFVPLYGFRVDRYLPKTSFEVVCSQKTCELFGRNYSTNSRYIVDAPFSN